MITVKNFSKKYVKKSVFENISVKIPDNEVNFLMGKNGSGKTTLLKCVSGLEKYSGEILFNGKKKDEVTGEVLVIWDDCPFYSELSGINNLEIFCEEKMSRKEITDRVSWLIDEELLKKKVKNYSYGQKKKLSLALSDLLNPKYLMMDEISNGLDYDTLEQLKEMINEWKKDKNLILTGHQFSFYEGIVDNVFVIDGKGGVREYLNVKEKKIRLEEIYHETMH